MGFDFIDLAEAVKDCISVAYDKDKLVTFTIKEVKLNEKYKNFTVACSDDEGNKYDFKFGGENMSVYRKKSMIAFLSAFFTREQLLANKANPIDLVGQRFEAKSNGLYEKEGSKYQQWKDSFRKLEPVAAAEEFMV